MGLSSADRHRRNVAERIHQSAVEKCGGVEFFRMIVIDVRGQPLGEVRLDKYGNTEFVEIGKKKV